MSERDGLLPARRVGCDSTDFDFQLNLAGNAAGKRRAVFTRYQARLGSDPSPFLHPEPNRESLDTGCRLVSD